MRIAFTTFGCKINQYDTDVMRNEAVGQGGSIVPFDSEADVYVINTCSVTAKSDYQCRQAIRSAVRRGKGAKVIVTGCYAETRPEAIRAIPGVDEVLGNREKQLFQQVLARCGTRTLSPGSAVVDPPASRTRRFLKIQDGCDGTCTYCIVPRARGSSRSIQKNEVERLFDEAVASGAPEIVLSGIHIGNYGRDLLPETSLTELVEDLLMRRGGARLRISSIEPREITPRLIEMLGHGLCRHLHIPLQSGDDDILAAMNRDYTSSFYRDLVESIASRVPNAAIGADVMVGFPGETEKQFDSTCHLVEKAPLTHLHVFSYSRRDGTPAANMPTQVSESEKKSRNERLRSIGARKNLEFRKHQIGIQLDVVLEGAGGNAELSGLSDNYIRIVVNTASRIGDEHSLKVRLDFVEDDLSFGSIVPN